MKRIFALAAIVFSLPVFVSAQTAQVGVSAGITSSDMYGEVGGNKIGGESRRGYGFGMFINAPIKKTSISFMPGLYYVQKGNTQVKDNNQDRWTALRYAELQANFVYNTNGPKGNNFFIGGGPSFGVNLPSAFVAKTIVRDPTKSDYWLRSEDNVNVGNEANSHVRFADYGVNVLMGYRLKCGWGLSFNYSAGLRNIKPMATGDDYINNHVMGLQLSYLVKNK
ncbi:MAG: hypothetical protein RL750_151 [Bacteroidota bacterium]|jgi:hypothetical protein